MAKGQRRKNRWNYREWLKWRSNRQGNIKSMHPQVRKQVQKEKY